MTAIRFTIITSCLLLSGCCYWYEPYPAFTSHRVMIEDVPQKPMQAFREHRPTAELDAVASTKLDSFCHGFHRYVFRFHAPDGPMQVEAYDRHSGKPAAALIPPDDWTWEKLEPLNPSN